VRRYVLATLTIATKTDRLCKKSKEENQTKRNDYDQTKIIQERKRKKEQNKTNREGMLHVLYPVTLFKL